MRSPGTLEGRRLGGRRGLETLRRLGSAVVANRFVFPEESKNLAEFIGILLGDGGITQSQATITLNSIADKDYISYVGCLGELLFGRKMSIYQRKREKATTLQLTGVLLIKFLMSIGLKQGNKVKQQVDVPEWIKQNTHYRIACTRGLMDTDGGIFLHKYKVNGKQYSYRKICFTNKSRPLLQFVYDTLYSLKLTPKYGWEGDSKRVWVYDSYKTERYLDIIGSHNPRLFSWRVSQTAQGMVC